MGKEGLKGNDPAKHKNPNSPGYIFIDLNRLDHVTGNDEDLKAILLRKYVEVTHQWAAELDSAVGKNDILMMRRVLHQIKPHLTMIGSEYLEKEVTALHACCHIGEGKMNEIRERTSEFKEMMPGMREELNAELMKL
jgi:HPt (histidine-containing phosphotransfer) domain-containing protein